MPSRVTLTFDLLTPKVDPLMSLPRGPLVRIIGIRFSSFVFKVSCAQI